MSSESETKRATAQEKIGASAKRDRASKAKPGLVTEKRDENVDTPPDWAKATQYVPRFFWASLD